MEGVDRLVSAILASPKYRTVSKELIRNIGQRELANRRNWKEAVKATKNKLHQVAGAYVETEMRYAAWMEELEPAASGGDAALWAACARIMNHHASTRERLPIVGEFYSTLLAGLPPVHTVLDIACGLNPLALPWMPFDTEVSYRAYDIYTDMIAFLNRFFALAGRPNARAQVADVVGSPPVERADLALVLKTLPVLEQMEKGAGLHLLRSLRADHLIVSFPAHSLGGQSKGMVENYEARFLDLIAGEGWRVERFEFKTELAFRVGKSERVKDEG